MKRLMATLFVLALAGQRVFGMLAWSPPCCTVTELQVEGLLLRPSTCSLPFALLDPRPFSDLGGKEAGAAILQAQEQALPQGRIQSMRPDYKGGVRLTFGAFFTCGPDLSVSWTYLPVTQSKRFDAEMGGLWEIFAHPNNVGLILYNPVVVPEDQPDVVQLPAEAVASRKVRYHSFDARVGARGFSFCYLWWRMIFGVHLVSLRHRFSVQYSGQELPGVVDEQDPQIVQRLVVIESSRRNSVWGVGPCAGLDASYDLGLGLGFGGRLYFGGLAGRNCHTRQETLLRARTLGDNPGVLLDQQMDVSSGKALQTTPFVHARMGGNWSYPIASCAALTLEFGYEYTCYFNLLRHSIYTSTRATSRELCPHFALDGFYLSLLVELR